MLLIRHYAQDGIKLRVDTVRGDKGAHVFVRAKVIDPHDAQEQSLLHCTGRCSEWSKLIIPNGGYKGGLN